MFRTKKTKNNNEPIFKKKSNILNSNESSTDEGSNQKKSINQLKQKPSQEIIILNHKTLFTHIPSIVPSCKRNDDYKKDNLIKEIIGTDEFRTEELIPNKFKSEYDLDNINNKNANNNSTLHNNISFISNNSLKIVYSNKKENKNNKFKRKNSLNINRLKIFESDCNFDNHNTPKNYMEKKTRTIKFNTNENTIFNIYKNDSKSQMKFENNNNINKQELKAKKQKKLEKIIQIMNNNNSPSLNVNLFRKEGKENGISLLSNVSNRTKKIFTLQNNLYFNDIINSSYKRHKKKLMLKLNTFKKEKTDYYDNEEDNIESYGYNDFNSKINLKIKTKIKSRKFSSTTRDNFYRRSQNLFNFLNISNDNSSYNDKKSNGKSESKKKISHITLDSNNTERRIQKENINNTNQLTEKINGKNYKILLNGVQKRMSFLINNLIHYIEILKKNK